MAIKGKLRETFNIAGRVGFDLITDTPVLFATGDLVMAFHKAELTGVLTNTAVTAATIASRVYQTVTGKSLTVHGMPLNGYAVLTLNQAWTGGSILAQGIHMHGLSGLLHHGTAETLKILQTAFIFGMAVPALGLQWWQTSHGQPQGDAVKKSMLDPLSYIGVASIVGTADIHYPPLFFAAALLRKFLPNHAPEANSSLLEKLVHYEAVPERLIRTGYVLGGLMSLASDPISAAVYTLWGMGFQLMDKGKVVEPDAYSSWATSKRPGSVLGLA